MAWSLVQHPVTGLASGTSGSGTITATAGNLVLALVIVNPSATTVTVPTQTGNATWVQLVQKTGVNAGDGTVAIFGSIAQAGQSTTVATSWTGTATGSLVLAEFSGITGALIQDGSGQIDDHASSGSTAVNTPTYTPTVTGDLVVHLCAVDSSVTAAQGSPWTSGNVNLTNDGGAWAFTTGALSGIAANAVQTSIGGYISVIAGIEAGVAAAVIPDLIMAPPHR